MHLCGIYGNTAYIILCGINRLWYIGQSIYTVVFPISYMADQEVAKTSLRLPKNLMKRMKLYAIESEKSVTEIVIDACNEYLQKRKH
jgi:hypothetical protein